MNQSQSKRNHFLYPNAVDGLIVLVICATISLAYLRFSEPFRTARSEGHTTTESRRVELCMPEGSQWLVIETIEGFEDSDPRTGVLDMRLLRAYRASDSSIRVEMDLLAERDSAGRAFFRDRPLVLGMRLRFSTGDLVLEGSLCSIEPKDAKK